jgi:hypothetical protein
VSVDRKVDIFNRDLKDDRDSTDLVSGCKLFHSITDEGTKKEENI